MDVLVCVASEVMLLVFVYLVLLLLRLGKYYSSLMSYDARILRFIVFCDGWWNWIVEGVFTF